MLEPTVRAIHVGQPHTYGRDDASDPLERVWTTGFVKHPVVGPLWLGRTNLVGDGQADLQNHGGPEKAVCVYAAEHYPFWRATLAKPELPWGAFGENFTVEGLIEAAVCIGDVYAVGDALMQVSQPRQPCWKLARRWRVKDLAAQVQRTGHTGWYFRVLQEGDVAPGQPLRLLERPYAQWSVARANEIMHHQGHDRTGAAALAACPLLAPNWQATLRARAERDLHPDTERRLVGPNSDAVTAP
jgi:MOSC domain-containing protein YiiM